MNRIEQKFQELRQKNQAALILYLTAGDPGLKKTEQLIPALAQAGADIIELGVPFTDPTADGPTIQAAAGRALKKAFSLDELFAMVERVRQKTQVPLLLFSYYNPLFKYGEEKAASVGQESGIDGMLVVDLPPEESAGLRAHCRNYGLSLVHLATPVSDAQRLKLVAASSSGFVYYVSVTGITGARAHLPKDIKSHILELKKISNLPVAVGFGISRPEQAAQIAGVADGVVVGSALVSVIEKYGASPELIPRVQKFCKAFKSAMARHKTRPSR